MKDENMNYESMGDFEINKAAFLLAAKLGLLDFEDVMQSKNPDSDAVMYGDGANWYAWNGCNNPADAWPIMLENGIAPLAENGGIYGATTDTYEYYEPHGNVIYSCEDKNPLRAAMIVFLMMSEP